MESRSRSVVYRCKWSCDGADSIDQMIEKLEGQIAYLREMKANGYILRESVNDDYAFLKKAGEPDTDYEGSDDNAADGDADDESERSDDDEAVDDGDKQ